MRRAPAATLATLTILICACSGDGTPADGWGGTIADSAGVSIVANPERGLWTDGPPWRLEEEFRVGAMDAETGAQPVQLGLVSGVDFDDDGRVYVADQQAQMIHVFDEDGQPIRTLGTPGQGPGEIGQGLGGVFVLDGEVWAADLSNMRINRYAIEDGSPLGSEAIDFNAGIPLIWHRVGNRVVVQKRAMTPDAVAASVGDPVVTVGPQGGDTLALLPSGQSITMTGDVPRFRIFAPEPVWDASPDGRVLSALNTQYRIDVRDASGTLVRVVTKPFVTRPLTDTDERRLREAMRALMLTQGAPPPAVDQIIQSMTFADQYPAFARVMAGPRSTVWVQHIRTAADVEGAGEFNPQDMGSDTWDVFGEDGRFLGVMTLPVKFTPLLVDGDAFWGVQRDDLDVNSVVRYRLVDR